MKWSIQKKTTLAFGAVFLILFAAGFATYHSTTHLIQVTRQAGKNNRTARQFRQLLVHLTEMESVERDFVITGKDHSVKQPQDAVAAVNKDLQQLRTTMADCAEEQPKLNILESLVQDRLAAFQEMTAGQQKKGRNAALPAVQEQRAKLIGDRIRHVVSQFENEEQESAKEQAEQARAEFRSALLKSSIGGVVIGALLAAAVIILYINLGKRMQAEERYRDLMDNVNDGFFVTDRTGTITFANRALLRVHGFEKCEELVGHRFLEFVRPEQRSIFQARFTNDLESERVPDLVVTQVVRSDGSVVDLEIRLSHVIEHGTILGTRGVVRDISERKHAERALEEHATRLSALLENSPLAIVVVGDRQRVQMCNSAFEQLFQYDRSEVIGANVDHLIASEVRSDEAVEFTQRALRGESIHSTTRRCRRDGTAVDVELYVVPLVIQGSVVGGYGIYQDITERKQAEEERERLIHELQDALSKVRTLSGLLPICASCKKIRDDQGYWNQIEVYIKQHSEADFSHGICPECAKQLYPGFYKGAK